MAVIAIDFDGTMVNGETILPGVRRAINILREDGHKVIIHSCNELSWIKKVLDSNEVRYDYVWGETKGFGSKPLADLYVDDKGYHFPYNGDWNDELPKIQARLTGLDNRKW